MAFNGAPLNHLFLAALILLLLPVAIVDARERRIPNSVNLAIAVLGIVHAMLLDPAPRTVAFVIARIALTFAVFLALRWLVGLIRRGAAFGAGDIKFLAAAAAWVGFEGSAAVMIVASLLAIVGALATAPWLGFDPRRQLPFGPPLALGLALIVALNG